MWRQSASRNREVWKIPGLLISEKYIQIRPIKPVKYGLVVSVFYCHYVWDEPAAGGALKYKLMIGQD